MDAGNLSRDNYTKPGSPNNDQAISNAINDLSRPFSHGSIQKNYVINKVLPTIFEVDDGLNLEPNTHPTKLLCQNQLPQTLPTGLPGKTTVTSDFTVHRTPLPTNTAVLPASNMTDVTKSVPMSYANALVPKISPTNLVKPQLPVPHKNGNLVSIKLDEQVYQNALQKCVTNLLGRIIFHRGQAPLKAIEIKPILATTWKLSNNWSFTPIGKGFYVLHFEEIKDFQRIKLYGQSKISCGTIKLSQWQPDFVPSKQKYTTAHVWARIHDLPLEYFDESIVLSIASAAGTPLHVDSHTLKWSLGHFARVEIEVDLTSNLPQKVFVERSGYTFEVPITYEELPPFCSHCSVIGHLVAECRALIKAQHSHSLNQSAKEGHKHQATKVKPAYISYNTKNQAQPKP